MYSLIFFLLFHILFQNLRCPSACFHTRSALIIRFRSDRRLFQIFALLQPEKFPGRSGFLPKLQRIHKASAQVHKAAFFPAASFGSSYPYRSPITMTIPVTAPHTSQLAKSARTGLLFAASSTVIPSSSAMLHRPTGCSCSLCGRGILLCLLCSLIFTSGCNNIICHTVLLY